MRRLGMFRRFLVLLLALSFCVQPLPLHAAEPELSGTGAFANSDATADTPEAFYELDPDSGVLLRRDPVTLQAEALTEEPIAQMALLGDRLYLLRQTDDALLLYTPADGTFRTLRFFDGTPLRFAVTEREVYYLFDGRILCSAHDGSGERTVVAADGLYRFWLDGADALEYMTEGTTIHRLELATGETTARENVVTDLSSSLRGLPGINQLKKKYPSGKYWNHVGGPNNPDGWTDTPCTHHGYHGSGCNIWENGCACNYYHESIQCYAFAYKLTDEYYGSNPDDWDNRIWYQPTDGIKAGDVFRYKYNRHTIWITRVDGDIVTFVDCNYNGSCVIRWNVTASIYTLKTSANWRDIAPYELDTSGDVDTPVVTTERELYYDDNRIAVTWTPARGADAYTVAVEKDGELLSQTEQADCELTLSSPEPGEYTVTVTGFNDVGVSDPGSCSFTVLHTERNTVLALWAAQTEQGEACDHLLTGESYVVQYRLFDTVTGQPFDDYNAEPFSVSMTLTAPDGTEASTLQTEQQTRGSLALPEAQTGTYVLEATVTGAWQGREALELPCREPSCEDIGHLWDNGTVTAADDGQQIVYVCARCSQNAALQITEREEYPAAAGFEDMPEPGHWSHLGLGFLLENGIMNGVSATRLAPEVTMDRAMLVTLLWRLEDRPPVLRLSAFTDVATDAYYAEAVAWAARSGVVKGTSEDKFSPTTHITREQLATILYRYAARRGASVDAQTSLSEYPDAEQVSAFAEEAMAWAVERGLILGASSQGQTCLLPKASATRAQVATILRRFVIDLAGKPEALPEAES